MSRTALAPLTGSQIAKARALLKVSFPAAEITAGQLFSDAEGAIIQFHDPTRKWGAHGTILVRWNNGYGPDVWGGHYFDDEFAVDVDFIYRARRGY
jgi:hypothetical protein